MMRFFAVREDHVVDLGLDLFPLAVLFQRGDVDLVVEVADVADDGLVLHGRMCSKVMTSRLPVVVTKMSALAAAYSMVTTRSLPSRPAGR
jgi:hypothetical protein